MRRGVKKNKRNLTRVFAPGARRAPRAGSDPIYPGLTRTLILHFIKHHPAEARRVGIGQRRHKAVQLIKTAAERARRRFKFLPRKIRSKSFNAFSSINFPDVAVIRNSRVIRYLDWKPSGELKFYTKLDPRVFTLKLIPGMDAGVIRYLMPHYDALIIESFGVGGIPCYEGDTYMKAIEDWVGAGKLLVMTTQVPNEGSDMIIYNVGSRIKERFDLLEAYDMTPEATVTKLMWLLGTYSDYESIKKGFYTQINSDIMPV